MASLAKTSRIIKPLVSADTCATVSACETIGATINPVGDAFFIDGVQGEPQRPENVIGLPELRDHVALSDGRVLLN